MILMERLNDILNFNSSRLLNYFGFRLTIKTDTYAIFSNTNRKEKYFLFSEENKDTLSIFSSATTNLLTKEELLFNLAGFPQLSAIPSLIKTIADSKALDPTPSFDTTISPPALSSIACGIGTVLSPLLDYSWTSLPSFAKRIFFSPSKLFVVPFCLYEDRKFISFVNAVSWGDKGRSYLNHRTDGFYSSHLSPTATKVFITSSPSSWQRLAITDFSTEYFYLLAHDDSTHNLFNALHSLCVREKFAYLVFPITSDTKELQFVCNFLNNFFLKAPYSYYCHLSTYDDFIQLTFKGDSNAVTEMNSFITHFNSEGLSFFFDHLQDQYKVNSNIEKHFKATINRSEQEGFYLYSIHVKRHEQLVHLFLSGFISVLYPKLNVTFLVLE